MFAAEVVVTARRHDRSTWGLVRTYGLAPQLSRAVLRRRRSRHRGDGIPVRTDVAALGMRERLGDFAAPVRACSSREAHVREITSGHIALALEGSYHVDEAAQVERRYRFLDRRLAELCPSLPATRSSVTAGPRSIARRAPAGVLPETSAPGWAKGTNRGGSGGRSAWPPACRWG